MKWTTRRRRHDDAHLPLQGRGKRARGRASAPAPSSFVRCSPHRPVTLLGYVRSKFPLARCFAPTEAAARRWAFEAVAEEWSRDDGAAIRAALGFNRAMAAGVDDAGPRGAGEGHDG